MTWTGSFEFLAPARIVFGPGSAKRLGEIARQLGRSAPLILTDPGLHRLGITETVETSLREAGLRVATSTDVTTEPTLAAIKAAADAYRAHEADLLVAVGGGSTLDSSKAVSLILGNAGEFREYQERRVGNEWIPAKKVERRGTDLVTVPTTAGTGSETGRASVITDETTHTKKVIFHPKMMPSIVIADPELTVGLPARLTAGTGMDAFIHCFEAYCAPGYHPYAEGIAVEGMRLVKENLARAVKDGRDIEARGHMLAASQMGSTAFQKGLGAIHSLSHPVGAVLDTHHGLTNAVAMPYVVKFNRAAIEEKVVRLARWLNLRVPTFDGFMQWTLDLRREVGIPHTLAELGVKAEHLDKFSEMAAVDPTAGGNPIKVGAADMRKMYEAAVAGRL